MTSIYYLAALGAAFCWASASMQLPDPSLLCKVEKVVYPYSFVVFCF